MMGSLEGTNLMIRILLLILLLTGCTHNPHVKKIMDDLRSTPKCNSDNIYVDSKDTKETLKAKVIILNYKLDCHVDRDTVFDEKFDNYSELD